MEIIKKSSDQYNIASKGVVRMKVRGIVIVSLQAFIKDRFGEDHYRTWEKKLPRSSREIYDNIILIDEWYPLKKAVAIPLEFMCDLFYDGNAIGARYSGRFSAIYGLKSKFKHLLVSDPADFEIDRYEKIFHESYKPAEIELIGMDSGNPTIRILEFQDIDEFLESRIAGWIEKGLEFNSCLYNTVEITNSLAKGDPYTEIVVNRNVVNDVSPVW